MRRSYALLWRLFDHRGRMRVMGLFALMLVAALIEAFAVASLLPFLSGLGHPAAPSTVVALSPLGGAGGANHAVFALAILFSVAVVAAIALKHIGFESSYRLLRMTFDEALDLFPEHYFDFIYIDGFAHTGEEGGRTLGDWYGKLKIGGILSGDDYHRDWPLVMWAVNHFVSQLGCPLHVTEHVLAEKYSKYPSWFIRKEKDVDPSAHPVDQRLVEIANKERDRIHRMQTSRVFNMTQRILQRIKRMAKYR